MYQLLSFDAPIPSCAIFELKFNEKAHKWTYIYALDTPFELTDDNEKELIIYEYISDLTLKVNNLHPESINIKIKTLSQYLKILELQRIEDIRYRENWIKENPKAKPNTITLENKNYSYKELQGLGVHFIASELNKAVNHTVFTGI